MGVVPTILTLKMADPVAHQIGYTEEDTDKWKVVEAEGSMRFLELAKEREEMSSVKTDTDLAREKENLRILGNITEEIQQTWLRGERIHERQRANDHMMRLKSLLSKSGKSIPGWLMRASGTRLEGTRTREECSNLDSQSMLTSTPVKPRHQAPSQLGLTPATRYNQRRGGGVDFALNRGRRDCLEKNTETVLGPEIPTVGREVGKEIEEKGEKEKGRRKEEETQRGERLSRIELESIEPEGSNKTESSLGSDQLNKRRFMSQQKLARKKVKTAANIQNIFTNYSKVILTEPMAALLNLGPNFCPTGDKINKLDIRCGEGRLRRSMRFDCLFKQKRQLDRVEGGRDVDDSTDEEEEDDGLDERILPDRDPATSLPRRWWPPQALVSMENTNKLLLTSRRFVRPVANNLTKEMQSGLEDLVSLQREGVLTIKKSSKAGGFVLLDTESYISEVMAKLEETFVDDDGVK